MLTALLLSYLLGGDAGGLSPSVLSEAWVHRIEQRVRIVVDDRARRRRALDALDELDDELASFARKFAGTDKPLARGYEDHTAGVERMRSELTALDARWVATQERMLDLRLRLRESLTREEWARIFEAP